MKAQTTPLAESLRPSTLDEFIGQPHLLGEQGALSSYIDERTPLVSMLFWGPPGSGKTTLARLLAQREGYTLMELSAPSDGVKAMRDAFATAVDLKALGQQVILFIDELHRFSRSQQDALLPVVEKGTVVLIGATTEHPSFELNRALLSRLALFILQPLDEKAQQTLINRAINALPRCIEVSDGARQLLRDLACGDGRRLISLVERAAAYAERGVIDVGAVRTSAGETVARFDHQRDEFYDQISALHKSVRGSDPDAAIYWFARMLEGGADPLYISRRLVRMASEDVGNSDPRALELAVSADQAYRQLGKPEGELALAQVVLYLASTVKSNAAEIAYMKARRAAKETAALEVPEHLKMGTTAIDKALGHGVGYRYSHDEPNAYSKGQHYFPNGYEAVLYEPSSFGVESKLAQRLQALREKG